MRGHEAGSSGRKPSGGSSSTGKGTEDGTGIVSEYGSEDMWRMLARGIRGGKTRLAKARSMPAKRAAGPCGVALRCNSASHDCHVVALPRPRALGGGLGRNGSSPGRSSCYCERLVRRVTALALALLLGAARPTAALVCGKPSRLRHVSPAIGPAARAGPLWLVTGATGSRAVVELQGDYPTLVYPTKVLIGVQRPLRAPITLRGRRCSDDRRLRFWYHPPGSGLPEASSPEDLERMGDVVAMLTAGEPPITVPGLGYPGYMLFSGPGKWKVSARRGGRLLGTAIIRVVAR